MGQKKPCQPFDQWECWVNWHLCRIWLLDYSTWTSTSSDIHVCLDFLWKTTWLHLAIGSTYCVFIKCKTTCLWSHCTCRAFTSACPIDHSHIIHYMLPLPSQEQQCHGVPWIWLSGPLILGPYTETLGCRGDVIRSKFICFSGERLLICRETSHTLRVSLPMLYTISKLAILYTVCRLCTVCTLWVVYLSGRQRGAQKYPSIKNRPSFLIECELFSSHGTHRILGTKFKHPCCFNFGGGLCS